jgi:hypothetical protein
MTSKLSLHLSLLGLAVESGEKRFRRGEMKWDFLKDLLCHSTSRCPTAYCDLQRACPFVEDYGLIFPN